MKKEVKRIPELRFPGFGDEWLQGTLAGLFSIFNGYAFPSDASQATGCRWVKIADVGINHMRNENLSYLPNEYQKKHKKFVLKKGDYVVALTRPILSGKLKIAKITSELDGSLLNQRVGKITSNHNCDFVYHFLQKEKVIYDIESNIAGTDPPNLSPNEIATLKAYYPPLKEQQKIASFLVAVDKKIEQLTRKKELLEQYKKGVMQKIFSQEIRFKNDNGEDYPGWEEKRLGEISDNIGYGMNRAAVEYDGDNKYIRITDIAENDRTFSPNPVTSPDGPMEDNYLVSKSDILFARTGASVGKSYLYDDKDGKLYFAGFLIRFSIKRANPFFIYTQTLLPDYRKWVQVMSMRSGQPGINAEEYKSLKIALPVEAEQLKIANFLSSIDTKINTVQTQLIQTQNFKKGLLQKMFV